MRAEDAHGTARRDVPDHAVAAFAAYGEVLPRVVKRAAQRVATVELGRQRRWVVVVARRCKKWRKEEEEGGGGEGKVPLCQHIEHT